MSEINEVALENSVIDKEEGNGKSLKYAIGALFTLAVGCGIAASFTVGIVLFIIAAVCGGLGLVLLGCYKWQFGKKTGGGRNDTNESIVDATLRKDALLELRMKYHIAGMWIDRFHQLSIEIGKVYDRLTSYNDTLRAWQRSYFEKVRHPIAAEGQMFRTLDSVALPDQLFEANKREIVRKIDLLRVFESYKANVDDLNNSLENLRSEVRNSIDSIIGDFSIANYLLGDSYPYLAPVDLQKELPALLAVGQPSYRNRVMNATPPVRMVMANVEPTRSVKWESNVISGFPPHPIQLPLIDRSMMLLLTLHPLADEL